MDEAANMGTTPEGGDRPTGFDWATVEAWLRQYYWIAVIVGIIVVSVIVSGIVICVCRTKLSQGLSRRFTKSFVVKRTHKRAENSVYFESSVYGKAPPLPPRQNASAEENSSYSYVDDNRSKMEPSSQASVDYIDVLPEGEESEYDDAIILPQRWQATRTLHGR